MLLLGVAAVAFVYAASLLIVDVIQGDALERSQTAQVALSCFWGVVGLVAIVVGLTATFASCASAASRCSGSVSRSSSSTTSSELDELYRVLSFVAVGLLLLGGAYAYQRVRTIGAAP